MCVLLLLLLLLLYFKELEKVAGAASPESYKQSFPRTKHSHLSTQALLDTDTHARASACTHKLIPHTTQHIHTDGQNNTKDEPKSRFPPVASRLNVEQTGPCVQSALHWQGSWCQIKGIYLLDITSASLFSVKAVV